MAHKFSELTLEEWLSLTPGQKAKASFDFYVALYPTIIVGESYQYKAGRDMKWLTDIFKIEQMATPEDVGRRFTRYLRDKSAFLCRNGHALNHFNWNAYSQSEFDNATNGQGGYRFGQRQGVTLEDVERATREIRDEATDRATKESRN